MTSLYDQSVPMMIKYLNNASKILDKTVTFAKDNDKNLDEILTFRLRDDMRPLPYQIQSMSDTAKAFASRVLGHPETHYEDNETTIPELQERITKTIKLLESVDQTAFDAEKIFAEISRKYRSLNE
ncbi:hypothetical protein M7I_8203 [Glarea lozoyensis 74030]|uniref:Uncharacterized protein n=1 Tax=Glarea lozoyensis (strain ATCC 74030 / MF5533) TaxID=1104152 RepID=H0EZD8_GLAL7|nr:hypothetical protein M7I_8203 [Glarea lozoyensis 74030]